MDFTEEEVKALITSYDEYRSFLTDKSLVSKSEREKIWNWISQEVASIAGVQRSAQECKIKVKNLAWSAFAAQLTSSSQSLSLTNDLGSKKPSDCIFCSQYIATGKYYPISEDLVEPICTFLNLKSVCNWKPRLMDCSLCPECHHKTIQARELISLLDVLKQKLLNISTFIKNVIRKKHFYERGSSHTSTAKLRADMVTALNKHRSTCSQKQLAEKEVHEVDNIVSTTAESDVSISNSTISCNQSGEFQFADLKEVFTLFDNSLNNETENCRNEDGDVDQDVDSEDVTLGYNFSFDDQELKEEQDIDEESTQQVEETEQDKEKSITEGDLRKSTEISGSALTRQVAFSEMEIRVLLTFYQKRKSEILGFKKSYLIWCEIAATVSRVRKIRRTAEQCFEKFKNIKKTKARVEIEKILENSVLDDDEVEELNQESLEVVDLADYGKEKVKKKENVDGPPRRRPRSELFSLSEDQVLLCSYTKQKPRIIGFKRSYPIWCKIAADVSGMRDIHRTAEQCRERLRNIKKSGGNIEALLLDTLTSIEGTPAEKEKLDENDTFTDISFIGHEGDVERVRSVNRTPEQCLQKLNTTKKIRLLSMERGDQPEDKDEIENPDDADENDNDDGDPEHRQQLSNFSSKEYVVLRREYLKWQLVVNDGKYSTDIWYEIAKTVSEVEGIERTPKQCKEIVKLDNEEIPSIKFTENSQKRFEEVNKHAYSSCTEDIEGEPMSKIAPPLKQILVVGQFYKPDCDGLKGFKSEDNKRVDPNLIINCSKGEGEGDESKIEEPDNDDEDWNPSPSKRARIPHTSQYHNFTNTECRTVWELYKKKKNSLRGLITNYNCWKEVAKIVSKVMGIERNATQCYNKVRNMKRSKIDYDFIFLQEDKITQLQSKIYGSEMGEGGDVSLLKEAKIELLRCDVPGSSKDVASFLRRDRLKNQVKNSRIQQLKTKLHRKKYLETVARAQNRSERMKEILLKRKGKKSCGNSKETSSPFGCPHCPLEFTIEDKKDRHVARSHNSKQRNKPSLNCPVGECGKKLVTPILLERHIRDEHEVEFTVKCEVKDCNRGFFTATALERHIDRQHNESAKRFPCDLCPKRFLVMYSLQKHKMWVHDASFPYNCNICNKPYRRKIDMIDHLGKVHGDVNSDRSEQQTCSVCGFISASKTYLVSHMRRHKSPFSYKYKCQEKDCDFRTETPSRLQRHSLTHSSERNFQCHLCAKTYNSIHRLNYHISRHDGATPHKCQYCERSFASKRTLSGHIDVIHMPKNRFTCESCGEGFPIKKYYNRHRLICAEGYSGTAKGSAPRYIEARRRRER